MRTTREFHGTRVIGGRNATRRIGKILRAVFSEDGSRLVGYIIARPDFLFMVKRRDRFLAYDAFRVVDGRVVATIDKDSWDEPACQRLGIDWDKCLILEGMKLVTESGDRVGMIDSAEYDEKTGEVISIQVGDGMASKAILGVSSIPIDLIVGYKNGQVVARAAASDFQSEGGLAAKAGEQFAVASNVVTEKADAAMKTAKELSNKAGKAAGTALDTGSKALGKQLGKTKGMFKAFKEEYQKEASRGRPVQSSKGKPTQTEKSKPAQITTSKSVQTTTSKSTQTAKAKPAQTTTSKPVQSTNSQTAQATKAKPAQTGSSKSTKKS